MKCRLPLHLIASRPASPRSPAERAFHGTAIRLHRFSVAMIVLTGILAGALLVVGLIPLFLDLIVIWIAVALMLVAVAGRLSRGTAFGQLPGYRVLPHGSGSWAVTMAFPLAVAGVTAVAGSFFMAGVPLAGGLVLTTAAASILIVMLAGASA